MDKKTFIAKRVAQELRDGYVVNLGIGLPTMVANFVPKGMHVTFQAENGMLGVGPAPSRAARTRTISMPAARTSPPCRARCSLTARRPSASFAAAMWT